MIDEKEFLGAVEQELSTIGSDILTLLTELETKLKEGTEEIAAELAEIDKILNGE